MRKFFYGLIMISSMNYCYSDNFVTDSLSDAKILSQSIDKPVLVIFGSPDCVYCEQLKHDIFDGDLKTQISDTIICYVNIEKYPEYRKEYEIRTILDSRFFYNNKEDSRLIGYSKKKFKKWLDNYHESSK